MAKTRIVIITDAWEPQVNGVVTTYKNIIGNIKNTNIDIIHPNLFKTFEFRFYKGVFIPIVGMKELTKILEEKSKDQETYFHIATEGWLGLLSKLILDKKQINYTSAFHTKFPEFFESMYHIPKFFTNWYFEWFHKKSTKVMCSSLSNAQEKTNWNSVVLDKGYDEHFTFSNKSVEKIKTLLYVGRVSKEKNIEDFLSLDFSKEDIQVKKVVVGDGPELTNLKKKYWDVEFVGYKYKNELASYYQNADVFVFPSKNDTFGIVVLESMACGTPVAAYDVTGPKDQILQGVNGFVGDDLKLNVINCLNLDRKKVYGSVKNISWKKSAKQFVNYVVNNK